MFCEPTVCFTIYKCTVQWSSYSVLHYLQTHCLVELLLCASLSTDALSSRDFYDVEIIDQDLAWIGHH